MSEKTRVFIEALAKLCVEHGADIGSCGCCGSPWVKIGDEETRSLDEKIEMEIMRLRREETT